MQPVSRADYGMAARVTQLNLDQQWLLLGPSPVQNQDKKTAMAPLRRVTVWAQTELLDLAEEPLDTDVDGSTIELASLYDGLESGRWIIVSGERTDIPNTTGVTASELVMISGVTQGSRAPLCALFPSDYVPFLKVSYTTDADKQGDRLVVGELDGDAAGLQKLQQLIPLPNMINQQFCDQVQIGPGVWVNAYVPTADERNGNFPDFAGLLVDPGNGQPYPGGVIPRSLIGQVFAWRVSSAPVHTILTLANALAYTYDSTNVTIYGNVALATHGQTVGEVLGDGDATQAFQSFALGQKPLTYVPALTPAGVASTLVVRVNDIERDEVDSLAGLGPTDRDYVTQTDDSDQTTVVFGNGVHGARVPTGTANVKAVYRYGIGAAGNVDAGQISQLATHPQGAQGVINPLRASGGADRDTAGQARGNTPMALMALDRLVGVPDYAYFSRTFAGIGKASLRAPHRWPPQRGARDHRGRRRHPHRPHLRPLSEPARGPAAVWRSVSPRSSRCSQAQGARDRRPRQTPCRLSVGVRRGERARGDTRRLRLRSARPGPERLPERGDQHDSIRRRRSVRGCPDIRCSR